MEICCDTCPYAPTCEEIQEFNRDTLECRSNHCPPSQFTDCAWPDCAGFGGDDD